MLPPHHLPAQRDYFRSGMGAEVERPMKWIEAQDAWVRARCASAAAVAQQAVGQQAAGGGEGGATEQEQREQKGRGKGEKDARFWQVRPAGLAVGARWPAAAYSALLAAAPPRTPPPPSPLPERPPQAVCLALRQFDGLKDGYWARQAEAEAEAAAGGVDGAAGAIGAMSAWDFLFLESNGVQSCCCCRGCRLQLPQCCRYPLAAAAAAGHRVRSPCAQHTLSTLLFLHPPLPPSP